MVENVKYDLIIIWAGPAWYAAWIYASRYKLKNLIIWGQPGWTLATTFRVENYPWIKSASWKEIMEIFKDQASSLWTEIIDDLVIEVTRENNLFHIKTTSWKEFFCKYVIAATGDSYKKLWAPWEKEFFWRGVSYCATCDWMFFKDQDVIVIWWWNTALTQALYLSSIAKKVYIIHRNDSFRCDACWLDEAIKNPKIKIFTTEEVEEILWDNLWVTWVKLKSGSKIEATWIFVSIWNTPNTKAIDNLNLKKDSEWCLIVDNRQETSLKWLYAAWDITTNSNKFKQAITATAEWCIAVSSVQEDILRETN